ncbi:MAG: DUF3467 domain-containing protein [Rhodothermales bacterium]
MNDVNDAQSHVQLNIELGEDVAEGEYANLVMIAHSSEEFILDFIRVVPGVTKAKVKNRIIITPPHAKRLLAALADNIKRYEAAHGVIPAPAPGGQPVQFGGPSGEA